MSTSLRALQERFAHDAALLILKAPELGYTVTLGEGYRTLEQAQLDAAAGTGIVASLHRQRLAIDLNFFRDGVYIADGARLLDIGTWWKTLSPAHRWGGDFKTRPDGNHFSITPDGVHA